MQTRKSSVGADDPLCPFECTTGYAVVAGLCPARAGRNRKFAGTPAQSYNTL